MGLFDVAVECEEMFENFLTNIACKSGFMGFSVEESGSICIQRNCVDLAKVIVNNSYLPVSSMER